MSFYIEGNSFVGFADTVGVSVPVLSPLIFMKLHFLAQSHSLYYIWITKLQLFPYSAFQSYPEELFLMNIVTFWAFSIIFTASASLMNGNFGFQLSTSSKADNSKARQGVCLWFIWLFYRFFNSRSRDSEGFTCFIRKKEISKRYFDNKSFLCLQIKK